MKRRLVFFSTLTLPVACTIFNGLTPPDASVAADSGVDAGSCGEAGLCIKGQGLCKPQESCSSVAPCKNGVIYTPDGGGFDQFIEAGINEPTCEDPTTHVNDGPPMTWGDSSGTTRYACIYRPLPPDAGVRPLVVFVHALGGSADDIYNLTDLRTLAVNTDVGDSGPGFVLASDQGRNLNSVDGYHPSGPEHDIYYRDYDSNPDFEAIDYLVNELIAKGGIDTNAIYMMGWGEGAFFAEEYGIIRNIPSEAGFRVAAAAVYEGADPFQGPQSSETDCTLNPYPKVSVPLDIVHRACSYVACDGTQASTFHLPPGYNVEGWVEKLLSMDAHPQDHIISIFNTSVNTCTCPCTATQASLSGNVAWPKGETAVNMLKFLGEHRL